jgi:hypothetical protein
MRDVSKMVECSVCKRDVATLFGFAMNISIHRTGEQSSIGSGSSTQHTHLVLWRRGSKVEEIVKSSLERLRVG